MPRTLHVAVLLVLAAASARPLAAQDSRPAPVVVGQGPYAFEWQRFGRRPDGRPLGNTHGGIAVDGAGRVWFNTDTADAIMVFEADGSFVRASGKEWAAGLHGMLLRREGDAEVLYVAHTGRREAAKLSTDGKVLVTFAWPEASAKYARKEEYAPTSVAVAPSGEVFVADGYGKSFIHQYAADGAWMQSFAGPGTEPGRCRTPHGLFVDVRGAAPRLVVADRENGRLQLFDLDGRFLREVKGDLRRPCGVDVHGDLMAVADLAGRVTLLDADYRLVAHLGENPDQSQWARNDVPSTAWKDGVFISPHAVKFDARGDLYVMDWVSEGRVTKLVRQPAK